jgi:serine/threonine-protein kinase
MREADILAKINHPNIVKIFEYGLSPKENVPYFIMEFVDGNPLNEHITAGDLSIKDKLVIIKQIASALAFIHEQGILHRDVKPANIIVMDDKTVKLTDFGIARIAESELTITHEMLGTPAYMSPEAFNAAREKDQRSDIFSLGTICYELLTGIKPFSGETIAELMDSIQHEKPIEPMRIAPEIRPYVQDIMAKMLAKSPEDRFSSAAEVLRALEKEYVDFDNSSITRKFFRALLLRKPTWR